MKTYKAKLLFSNQEIYDFWVKQLCLVRDCYNYSSKIVFNENIPYNLKAFHNRLYKEQREKFTELPAQMCIRIYKALLANYRTVKSNKHKIDESIKMKRPSIQLDKRLYSKMTRTSFKLGNGQGNKREEVCFMTYPKFDDMMSKFHVCDPTIQYNEESGEFYGCFPFLNTFPIQANEECLGVDLGLKRIATLSNGTAYSDKKYLANRRKIRHNKRILQSKKKHSHSARTKLKKLKNKEYNISKNFCHHLANKILKTDKSIIVMEDLSNIKQTTSRTENGYKRKRHNNMMSQVPFYQLKSILTYKAQALGKRVETVSPEDTSQKDCRTNQQTGRRCGCRYYCDDGVVLDADWNASINIMNRYKHSNSFNLPIDGKLNLIDRVCQQPNSSNGLSIQASHDVFSIVRS